MHNLIVCMSVCDFECDCMCVRDPCWQLPMLPPQAVFAEACHCCCRLTEVNKGVQARMLFLTGSWAEALALPIKPITHSQLTPDSLSAYLAWRLRANRQRQRCQEGYVIGRGLGNRCWGGGGKWLRLFTMVSAEKTKGESKQWVRASLICGWRGHQEPPYNNYIRVK